MKIGNIESIWRYPVKSMRGEQLEHVYAGFEGIMGDRVYGIIATDGDPAFPWHTARDHEEFVLYHATYEQGHEDLQVPRNLEAFEGLPPGIKPIYPEQDKFLVKVKTPEGKEFSIESPEFLKDLEKITERQLTVHYTQKGHHDCFPISIFSIPATKKLGEEIGMQLDKRRFRANLYVEWDNLDDFDLSYEFSLIGKNLKIGHKLEVRIIEPDVRCKMITIDPDTSEESPKILQHISNNYGGNAGVWATVLQEGIVKKGDEIIFIQ